MLSFLEIMTRVIMAEFVGLWACEAGGRALWCKCRDQAPSEPLLTLSGSRWAETGTVREVGHLIESLKHKISYFRDIFLEEN
jgi:hypothetical protein